MTKTEKHMTFWLITAVVIFLLLFSLREILLPFILGIVLAYFLDPVADALEKLVRSRGLATILIVLIFGIVMTIVGITLLPLLVQEIKDLASSLPDYAQKLKLVVGHYAAQWFGINISKYEIGLEDALRDLTSNNNEQMQALLQRLWDGGMAIVNTVSLLLITPVVTLYLLYDWDRMLAKINGCLPRKSGATIRTLASEIDGTLSGFIRGQVIVCLLLAIIYSTGLTLLGLKNGLLIGIAAGLLSFIPYVGAATGFVTSMIVALTQFWPDWWPILLVLGVFGFGQALDSVLFQPKIVGGGINLHPVWLIFALFVFAYLMGFVGMLVAVPLAATLGVLARFGVKRYMESDFYLESGVAHSVPHSVPLPAGSDKPPAITQSAGEKKSD